VHDQLTSTVGIVALAAGVVAVVALLSAIALAVRLGRLRADQRAVLGDSREDLVAHAAALQGNFAALHDYVEDVAQRLQSRMDGAEQRLDGAISYSSLVRYDAYGEMSGRQSVSIALLDAKQVVDGRGELELSPEESEAVTIALRGRGDGQPALR
jgi:hypothetical protein